MEPEIRAEWLDMAVSISAITWRLVSQRLHGSYAVDVSSHIVHILDLPPTSCNAPPGALLLLIENPNVNLHLPLSSCMEG